METSAIPDALQAELIKMRRNPQQFHVKGRSSCRFCGGKNQRAYQLLNQQSEFVAGSWCAEHGWLHFDSVAYPPTERLTASEIEDRKLSDRRKADFARRKATQPTNAQKER